MPVDLHLHTHARTFDKRMLTLQLNRNDVTGAVMRGKVRVR